MPAATPPILNEFRESLLSEQVMRSSAFFLDVAPAADTEWTLRLAGCERCSSDYYLDRPHYAYHALEYVAEGRGELVMDGVSSPLAPGTVFSYGPSTRCTLRTDPARPMLKYFFALAGCRVAERLREAGVEPGSVRAIKTHAEIQSVAGDLIREGQRAGGHVRAICLTLLELLLLKIQDALSTEACEGSLAQGNFLRCKAVIDANCAELKTLDDIARRAGMDVSSACRLFRRYQGVTPYQYLLRRKMALAAGYLIDSPLLVKEVARRVGFDDPYHFTRCFTKIHGVSPTAMRRVEKPAGV